MEIINLLLNFLFGISGIISMITIIDTKKASGGGSAPAPALSITIISEAEVRRRRGGGGGATTTPTLTEIEKKALITREQIKIEAEQRGKAFTRLLIGVLEDVIKKYEV